jgi:hypothetical protein
MLVGIVAEIGMDVMRIVIGREFQAVEVVGGVIEWNLVGMVGEEEEDEVVEGGHDLVIGTRVVVGGERSLHQQLLRL